MDPSPHAPLVVAACACLACVAFGAWLGASLSRRGRRALSR